MTAVVTLPLAGALWTGCSSDDAAAPTSAPDAAPETSTAPDGYVPPPADAATEAAPPRRDCAADVQADGLQRHLDCTGLYSDFTTKTIAAENKLYTPGVVLWTDGADKYRYIVDTQGHAALDAWITLIPP